MNDHTIIIKERLSIVDVVGSYIKLEKSGSSYKACCPFHTERTPSFFVVPDKNIYHCFGCGKSGDIFSFVQEIDGVTFVEALRLLADKAGVTLENKATTEKVNYQHLYTALELATKYFEVELRKDSDVVQYLLDRGMTKETIARFRLGYAKELWTGLTDRLLQERVTKQTLVDTGLAIQKNGRTFDRFRNRIMFPLKDSQGNVIGFSGRIFDARKDTQDSAKYMNSPETALYHKSTMLYGYDHAKRAMRETEICLLVEGQFDVVLAHQAGTENCVALSGTGMTSKHCELIKRFAQTLVFALDSDEAGIRAMRRSILVAMEHGLDVSILPLPQGEDPASMIQKQGASVWKEYVATQQQSVLDFELLLIQKLPSRQAARATHDVLFPLCKQERSRIIEDASLVRIAHTLQVSADALRAEYKEWLATQGQSPHIPPPAISKKTYTHEELLVGIVHQKKQNDQEGYRLIEERYTSIAGDNALEILLQRYADRLEELSFIAETVFKEKTPVLAQVIEELLDTIEYEFLFKKVQVLTKQSSKDLDEATHTSVLQELALLTKRLHDLRSKRLHY